MGSEIDIIIPVFNEEEALPGFYKKLCAQPIEFRPIFIDNGSTDGSLTFLQSIENATIIRHKTNKGYGASLRAGIRKATADKIIIIDADGEYSPEAIPHIILALDKYDAVHSSRFLGNINNTMKIYKNVGNRIITLIFNILFHQHLTDLYTGCKGYRRKCVASMQLQRNGFEHVLEISAKLVRKDIAIKEVPIHYNERAKGASKMNHILETAKYLILVMYYFCILR